jgi:tetratricopeptide (TPR) repeat protein
MTLALRRFKPLFLIYGMVGLYVASCLLFLVQSRYRTPAAPYLCLFAGYGLWAVKRMIVEKRVHALVGALVLAGVFFWVAHFPFRDEIKKVDQWQEATKIHYQAGGRPLFLRGDHEGAISALNQCLALVPDFSPALNLRGRSLAILGRYEEALADFEQVISVSPNLATGYKNAGFVYLIQNDKSRAKAYLTKAHALSPEDPKVNGALMKLE